MNEVVSYEAGRDRLLALAEPVGREHVLLADCCGRILGRAVRAVSDVPPFDHSPYDGYAFRAQDVKEASSDRPVSLRILEEIPAGGVPHFAVTQGFAVKILTGAPIPDGADAVLNYEATRFTEEMVTIFAPVKSGSNIVRAGEDVRAGEILAECGTRIDGGVAGILAAQNMATPVVYRRPKIGIISTGSELVEVGQDLEPGKIYNSNQYMLGAALRQMGCEPVMLGMARDHMESICSLILTGLQQCDGLLLTGGVSVGDYDLTPAAMEMAGGKILFRGVDLKPGMACAYGIKEGKLICGLSGNPASAITNFYAVAYPAFRRMCGYRKAMPEEVRVKLLDEFPRKSSRTRILRGSLELADGFVGMRIPQKQGNVVLSSTIGCNVMAVVPAGSGSIAVGTELKGFLL